MEKLSFKLTDFEGPLDLLLYLITKHKLNILEIEIAELLRQYLGMIESQQALDLEAASEFLEMAARLVHIKTVMLLPRHEEEAAQLKDKLTGELMEYQLCKRLAQQLGALASCNQVYVRRPMALDLDYTYRMQHHPTLLCEAVVHATGRNARRLPPPESAFSGIVRGRVVSVNARIIHLLRMLYKNNSLFFESLFIDSLDRSELVATFLAVLELIKGGRLSLSEDGALVQFHRARPAPKKEEEPTSDHTA